MRGLRSPAWFPVALLVAVGAAMAACSRQKPAENPHPLDLRVEQLSQWVPYYHPGDGGLYFLSRFELRREDVPPDGPADPRESPIGVADLPRVRLDFVQANWLAKYYFGRLPRADEWRHAVEGDDGWRYPWGDNNPSVLLANTFELGLYRSTRVGTFESGRDPVRADACYDLIGNVQEWTCTPFLQLLLYRIHRGTLLDPSGVKVTDSRPLYDDYLRPMTAIGWPFNPWGYASPLIVEALPSLSDPDLPSLAWITIGFSFQDALGSGTGRDADWYRRLGAVERLPREWTDSLGVRLATDPLTFLTRLDAASGAPGAQEIRALAGFLGRYIADFRTAAGRLQALDRDALGLPAPSEWARAAMKILGVAW